MNLIFEPVRLMELGSKTGYRTLTSLKMSNDSLIDHTCS